MSLAEQFTQSLRSVQKQVHENSRDKGFWNGDANRNIPTKLMLIVSEIGEAMEADRKGNPISEKLGDKLSRETGIKQLDETVFAEEMADAVIRIMDLCEWMSIDLASVILAKAKYNATREKMHGGKKY